MAIVFFFLKIIITFARLFNIKINMKKILSIIIALIFALGLNAKTTTEISNFTATDYFGNEIDLYEILEGGQYVLLHVNTRTNGATATVTPPLVEAYKRLGCNQHDVFFIGIVPNGTTNVTKKYVEEYGIEYPMIHNTDESNGMEGPAMDIWQSLQCEMPTTMLIAPDKTVALADIASIKTSDDVVLALAAYGIQEHECGEVEEPEETVLAAPVITEAYAENSGTIVIKWEAVEGAWFYYVYYQGKPIGNQTILGTEVEVAVYPETTYCFTVTAFNEAGESAHSEEVCVTTPAEGEDPVNPEGNVELVEKTFNIYPNPASTTISVIGENGDAKIFDMTGRCVKEVKVIDNTTINIEDLNGGVYFFNVNGKVRKLIIK